jgi:hypothetical protein
MLWLKDNWFWLAPAVYAMACEIIAHTPLKSNSVAQLFVSAGKAVLGKKGENDGK